MARVARVPLLFDVKLEQGGRWTSLTGGGREWLWSRHDPARLTVETGAAFVEAGGVEECLPTVRGTPDHGEVWTRAWRRENRDDVVEGTDFALRRRITRRAGAVVATYHLTAAPGFRFLWAAHAALDLSNEALLEAPSRTPTRVYAEAAPIVGSAWAAGMPAMVGQWPEPLGLPLSRLGGERDGTAINAVLRCRAVRVKDGPDLLRMRIDVDNQPVGVGLWRNLGGHPKRAPYRSIAILPMLGTVLDLDEAGPAEAAVVPASGEVTWRLVISAGRVFEEPD